jgi:hypothetical protein
MTKFDIQQLLKERGWKQTEGRELMFYIEKDKSYYATISIPAFYQGHMNYDGEDARLAIHTDKHYDPIAGGLTTFEQVKIVLNAIDLIP